MNFLFKLINHKFSTHLPDTILNKLRDLLRSLGRTKEKRLKIRTKLFKKYKNIKNTNNKFNLCGTKWMGKWSEVHTCATEDTSQSAGEKNSLGGYTKKHKKRTKKKRTKKKPKTKKHKGRNPKGVRPKRKR